MALNIRAGTVLGPGPIKIRSRGLSAETDIGFFD